jgi:hypothetical protein
MAHLFRARFGRLGGIAASTASALVAGGASQAVVGKGSGRLVGMGWVLLGGREAWRWRTSAG